LARSHFFCAPFSFFVRPHIEEHLEDASKYENVQAAGQGYLSRRYDGKWDDLSVPLKNGDGGAFF